MLQVTSEIGTLKRLIIHHPDGGIGKMAPGLKDKLLYDDIVDWPKMKEEYSQYHRLLLAFLDEDKIRGKGNDPDYIKATAENFVPSDKVIDVQYLLTRALKIEAVKQAIVPAVCALERSPLAIQRKLLSLDAETLSAVLISGVIPGMQNRQQFVFAPVPNLIFTRDIGITIHNTLLLTKFYEQAREREALLFKYIAFYVLHKSDEQHLSDKVIELNEVDLFSYSSTEEKEKKQVSIEGGDVMMISPGHLLVGMSERTSAEAVSQLIEKLFAREQIYRVSVIKIPNKRAYMHIDTVFTQVKRDTWILFSPFSQQVLKHQQNPNDLRNRITDSYYMPHYELDIKQFTKINDQQARLGYRLQERSYAFIDELMVQISKEDYNTSGCDIIQCAGGEFPYNEREQWTDACNFLALREGVIVGYDRNTRTAEEFRKRGFKITPAAEIITAVEQGAGVDDLVKGDTLISLPSSELSRARGGTHCMSLPLERETVSIQV
jgi:arginine deiminase